MLHLTQLPKSDMCDPPLFARAWRGYGDDCDKFIVHHVFSSPFSATARSIKYCHLHEVRCNERPSSVSLEWGLQKKTGQVRFGNCDIFPFAASWADYLLGVKGVSVCWLYFKMLTISFWRTLISSFYPTAIATYSCVQLYHTRFFNDDGDNDNTY